MAKAKQRTGTKIAHLNHQVILRDKRTGELTDYGDAEIRTEEHQRNKGFLMLWTQGLKSNVFELQFVFFLVRAMQSNYIHMTDEQLAKHFECTRQRIGRLKRQLEKDNLIICKPGIIFVNPSFIWKGSAYNREKAEIEYYKLKSELPAPQK